MNYLRNVPSKKWNACKHTRGLVISPYYYRGFNTPYFLSNQITSYDHIYNPYDREKRMITLDDNTQIEGFKNNDTNVWILFAILTACFAYVCYKKNSIH